MLQVLYELLYMLPASISALLLWNTYGGYEETKIEILLIGMFFLIVYMAIRHVPKKLKWIPPIIVVLITGVIVLLQEKQERYEFVKGHIWVLLVGGIVLGSMLLCTGVFRFVVIRRALAVCMMVGLLFGIYAQLSLDKITVLAWLFMILLMLIEEIEEHWKKTGDRGRQGHLVYIALFLLVLAGLVYVIPTSEKPYDWALAKNIWERTVDGIKMTSRLFHNGDEDYAGAQIGFSDNARFMSQIFQNDKPMLQVTANKNSEEILYLTGKVFDHFDGKQWTNMHQEMDNDRMMDTLETYGAIMAYDGDYYGNYIRNLDVTIEYQKFNTNYIFVPSKLILRRGAWEDMPYSVQGGNVLADEKLGYGDSYKANYLRLNSDHKVFVDFLQEKHGVLSQEEWNDAVKEYRLLGQEGYSYEDYWAYLASVQKYYGQQIVVSEGLQEYLNTYLDGLETDIEKLRMLELLLNHYGYTDRPGEMPAEIDTSEEYLDYFMLEKKEGFCSYYATAFVLLSRAMGIPARYVQGYYVPVGEGNQIIVTSNMAHAWAEAYIEGVGWIPFEATPGFRKNSYWAVKKKMDYTQIEEQEVWEHFQEEMFWPRAEKEETTELVEEKRIPWEWILALVASLLVSVVLIIGLDAWFIRYNYEKQPLNKKLNILFARNRKLLSFLGYQMREQETLGEYRARLMTRFSDKDLAFLEGMEKMFYGEQEITLDILFIAEENYNNLCDCLKEQKGKWFFWYLFQVKHA